MAKLSQKSEHKLSEQLDILLQKLGTKQGSLQKIALPTGDGFELVPLDFYDLNKRISIIFFIFSVVFYTSKNSKNKFVSYGI